MSNLFQWFLSVWPVLAVVVVCFSFVVIAAYISSKRDFSKYNLAISVAKDARDELTGLQTKYITLQSEFLRTQKVLQSQLDNIVALNSRQAVSDARMTDVETKFRDVEYEVLRPRQVNVRLLGMKKKKKRVNLDLSAANQPVLKEIAKKMKGLSQ